MDSSQIKEEHYELPFKNFEKPLKEILLDEYLKPVSKWLISSRENSLLAMEAKSVWETGLSVLFLADMADLGVDHLGSRAGTVSDWLLTKVTEETISFEGKDVEVCWWDKVTWDTSVVVRALLTLVDKYGDRFSLSIKNKIIKVCVKSCKWLYFMFLNWDKEVKYPFGPADLGQILTTILLLQEKFPNIYVSICKEFNQDQDKLDIATQIAKKILSIKTELTSEKHHVKIPLAHNSEAIVKYWWDDYFSSAEVVESLALFYVYCNNCEKDGSNHRQVSDKDIKKIIREALVKACLHFEKEQVDGMWGNHIDTIKVLYAYVRVRDLIPKNEKSDDPLLTPEIHTVFKALRWMCDEKQIFRDDAKDQDSPKSFMHTMYLTVFYAHTLMEIYHRWDPAEFSLAKIYDDVVWSSPTRTTPERAKRLTLELEYINLSEKLDTTENRLIGAIRLTQLTFFAIISFIVVFFGFGTWSKIVTTSFDVHFQQQGSSIDLISLFVALIVIGASVVIGVNKLFKR